MPGKTPSDALAEYVQPVRKSLECVTPTKLAYLKPKEEIEQALFFEDVGGAKISSKTGIDYLMVVRHKFVISQIATRSFKVRTLEYRYALDIETADGPQELFEYHWHPGSIHKFPHVHVMTGDPSFHKVHLPTCRISVEDFVRCLIDDFKIPPRIANYGSVLDRNRRKFFTNCNWVWEWTKGC